MLCLVYCKYEDCYIFKTFRLPKKLSKYLKM
jgi:hypothetical protein